MMPSEEHFSKMMRGINVRKNDLVVIYDKYRNISAPRTYFMMKCFGLPNVWVLNGTFEKWAKEKRAIDHGEAEDALKRVSRKIPENSSDFDFNLDISKIRKFEEIDELVIASQSGKVTPPLLDGRLSKYFERAHIPTSKSVPLSDVMDENYCFLPRDKMIEVF
jgi:3-mercaptopyruvate sulfurtransferase SseA